MAIYIGIDMGGTNLKAGAVDADTGIVSHVASIPTLAHEGPQAVMERMAELACSIAVKIAPGEIRA